MKPTSEKKTVQVNMRMTPSDLDLLRRAAEKRWPEAEMTLSELVLSLAKLGAKTILRQRG